MIITIYQSKWNRTNYDFRSPYFRKRDHTAHIYNNIIVFHQLGPVRRKPIPVDYRWVSYYRIFVWSIVSRHWSAVSRSQI